MSDLPAGWAFAFADDLTAPSPHALAIGPFGSNLKVSDYRDSGVPLVFVRNIRAKAFGSSDLKFVSGVKASTLLAHQVGQGDVLVTKMGDPPGDSAIYPLEQRGVITADCIKLTPHPSINGRYLMFALQTPAIKQQMLSITRGVAQPKVSLDRFRKGVRFPVAPTAEQDRIVAAIEEEFSRLDAGVTALQRIAQNLKRMRASVLQAAVSGQLVPGIGGDVSAVVEQISVERRATWKEHTSKPYKAPADPAPFPLAIPKHWRIASLEALTHPIRVICYGILMPKEHIEDGVPYVRVKDMKGWAIDVPGLNRTSPEIAAKYARASLHPGDLLLAIRGSYGRVAIVPPELDGANITQDSARIAAHPAIDHRYLLYYLGGSVADRYYQRVARGVAVKGVNIGDLRAMPVPIPPWGEQVAIADEVERQFSFLDLAEAVVGAQLRRAASLRSSILAAAFAGNLAPQDSGDEPADALLERITTEKQSSNVQGRGASSKRRRPQKGIAA